MLLGNFRFNPQGNRSGYPSVPLYGGAYVFFSKNDSSDYGNARGKSNTSHWKVQLVPMAQTKRG